MPFTMRVGMPEARASAAKRYAWPWHSARRSRSTSAAVKESIASLAMFASIQAMRRAIFFSSPDASAVSDFASDAISPKLLGAARVGFRYLSGSPPARGAARSMTHLEHRPPVGGQPGGALQSQHARHQPERRPLEQRARLPADDLLLGLGEDLRLA